MFLLMIDRRGWSVGKQESMMFRKVEATLVLTALLKGGLNHVTVLFRHLRRGWLALSSTLGGVYVSLCSLFRQVLFSKFSYFEEKQEE